MTSSSSNVGCPRSAFDQVGGLVYFARMLDKIRLKAEGKLSSDYHENLGKGFDGRCIRFLGVNYSALCERVSQGGSDEEILTWCFDKGRKPSEEEILIWNSFLRKRGWRDEADGVTQELENYKARSGMAQRTDIQTFFDYYEVDEGRRP
jgi:gluconokinase